MKYLCLVAIDERKLEALTQSESECLDSESLAYDDTLRKGGHLIAAQALQPAADHRANPQLRARGAVR